MSTNPNRDDCTGSDLVLGTIFGFRTWRLNSESNGLLSAARNVGWRREMVSECLLGYCKCEQCMQYRNHPEPAPLLGCECGLYAWHQLEEARTYLGEFAGVVEAQGRIIVGEKGMRAEKMRIIALCAKPTHDMLAFILYGPSVIESVSEQSLECGPGIAQALGVSWYPSLEAMHLEYPDQDVSSLLS